MLWDNLSLPSSRYKKEFVLDCLSFKGGTYRLSQNIGNYPSTYAALQLRKKSEGVRGVHKVQDREKLLCLRGTIYVVAFQTDDKKE